MARRRSRKDRGAAGRALDAAARRAAMEWAGRTPEAGSNERSLPLPQERVQQDPLDVYRVPAPRDRRRARAVYPTGASSNSRGMGRSPITAYHPWRVHGLVPWRAPIFAKQSSSRLNRLLSISRVRVPFYARFCIERRIRREVLFAIGKAGFSGSGAGSRRKGLWRTYRRTNSSQFSC